MSNLLNSSRSGGPSNPPAAAICGRGRGSPAIGHSLVKVRHDARRASVKTRLQESWFLTRFFFSGHPDAACGAFGVTSATAADVIVDETELGRRANGDRRVPGTVELSQEF